MPRFIPLVRVPYRKVFVEKLDLGFVVFVVGLRELVVVVDGDGQSQGFGGVEEWGRDDVGYVDPLNRKRIKTVRQSSPSIRVKVTRNSPGKQVQHSKDPRNPPRCLAIRS